MELEGTLPRLAAAGADVVAISSDDLATSTAFARDEKLSYPLLADPDMAAILAWGVRHRGKSMAVPAVFIVDRDGIVRWRRIGESISDRTDIEEILDALGASGKNGEALPRGR